MMTGVSFSGELSLRHIARHFYPEWLTKSASVSIHESTQRGYWETQ